jgi:hypothetical protein
MSLTTLLNHLTFLMAIALLLSTVKNVMMSCSMGESNIINVKDISSPSS